MVTESMPLRAAGAAALPVSPDPSLEEQHLSDPADLPESIDDSGREVALLEGIESDPDITQASLATQLGVAVGTVNWHLKRLISKGYVKVKRLQRRKLRYIITPAGIAYRARLTVHYIETSMMLYRRTRERVSQLLSEVRRLGYDRVILDSAQGVSDIVDICRLSCLEQGIHVIPHEVAASEGFAASSASDQIPILEVQGMKVSLKGLPVQEERWRQPSEEHSDAANG